MALLKNSRAAALCLVVMASAMDADAFRTRIEPIGPEETREFRTEQMRNSRETLEAQQKTLDALAAISRKIDGMATGSPLAGDSAPFYGDIEIIKEKLSAIDEKIDLQNALTREMIVVMQEQLRLNRGLFAFLDEDDASGDGADASAPASPYGMQLEVDEAPEDKTAPTEAPEPAGATWIVR